MSDTKAGRDPEGAEKQIAKHTNSQNTCPECGSFTDHLAEAKQPAGPQGGLAQWQKDHALLLEDIEYEADIAPLRDHLAAMPQAQPNAALLKALKVCVKGYRGLAKAVGGNIPDVVFSDMAQADAAIAQAETGAAG